jgi:hypothetical protein
VAGVPLASCVAVATRWSSNGWKANAFTEASSSCMPRHQPPATQQQVSKRRGRRAKLLEDQVESADLDDEGQVVAVDGAGRGEGHHAQSAGRGPRYRKVTAIGCSPPAAPTTTTATTISKQI